jgi:acyl carrier protein
MTKEQLFEKCVTILHETFGIEKSSIKMESRLYEELDIDSVDLIVRMKPMVGKRLQPEAFKAVRTVQDVVEALHKLIHAE